MIGQAFKRRPAAARPAGFTLTELLVTVAIVGILLGLVFGALESARETARINRTQSTIGKLHHVMMRRYDEYRTRRVPIDTSSMSPQEAALARLNAVRDLMRMEMPDRWSDVTGGPLVAGLTRPALSQRYYRAYTNCTHANRGGHAAAECLYLIVMSNPDDADQFSELEIGDYDGDGLREFHDGWGHPIRFVRWPAGFVPIQGADTDLQNDGRSDRTQNTLPANVDLEELIPDPFDPRNAHFTATGSYAFALFPLVYSAGPDGTYDINYGVDASDTPIAYSTTGGVLNPYLIDAEGFIVARPEDSKDQLGALENYELDHYDNIHNHRIEAR